MLFLPRYFLALSLLFTALCSSLVYSRQKRVRVVPLAPLYSAVIHQKGKWPSEAMHGWDKVVSTMRLGEVATLVCGPQYAFGAKGAPPKIPPNATIETRLELVDWMDLAATYNAKPGVTETDSEIMARWKQELADGTSPMRPEAGKRAGAGRGTRGAMVVAHTV